MLKIWDRKNEKYYDEELIVIKESKWLGPGCNSYMTYIKELEVQTVAATAAKEFREALKKHSCGDFTLKFIKLKLIIVKTSTTKRHMTMEKFIKGEYKKLSNNWAFVSTDAPEETVNYTQAFSHFSFEASKGWMMITDIQGVQNGDSILLTDPAIHCLDVLRFSDTNLSKAGMVKFFKRHKCNTICEKLGLPRYDTDPVKLLNIKWSEIKVEIERVKKVRVERGVKWGDYEEEGMHEEVIEWRERGEGRRGRGRGEARGGRGRGEARGGRGRGEARGGRGRGEARGGRGRGEARGRGRGEARGGRCKGGCEVLL